MNKLFCTAVGVGTLLSSLSCVQAAEESAAVKKAKQDKDIEIITVQGVLRSSFDSAVGIKRLADTVVDAITAEDIGQFSDDSIAGAIQRIPGVQIETDDAGTDGDRVSIRGLGPEFVNSTINGRRLLSSGTEARNLRKMNFNAFPPSILAGVRVAKGQTASRPESGLAGQIDLQTLRPLEIKRLDNKTSFGQISLRAEHQDISNDNGLRVNALGGWRNEEKTLGGYIGIVASESKTARDQVRVNYITRNLSVDTTGDGRKDATIDGVLVPNAVTMNPIREEPKRSAFAAGLQYQPSDNIDIVWDLMYSKYDNKSTRQQNQQLLAATWGATVFDMSDANNPGLVVDDNNVLRYADYGMSTKGGPIRNQITSMVFNNKTENLITGLNVNWIQDQLTTNFDFYYSAVDYSQNLRFPRVRKNLDKSQVIFDATGQLPLMTASNANDIAGYTFLSTIVREIELEGDNFGATAKFNYEFIDDGPIVSVDFGVHYDQTNLDSQRTKAKQFKNPGAAGAEIVNQALSGDLINETFLDDDNYTPDQWLQLDYDVVAALDPRVLTTGIDELGIDPAASYDSTESIFSFWSQANLDTEVGDLALSGNFGIRAIFTDHEATAAEIIDGGEPTPITTGDEYWEFLPSINLNLAITDDSVVRFGFSKTLSRPDYEQLAPINTLNIPEDPDAIGNSRRGNPDLKPMTSYNYDLTYELYNQYDGAFVLSAFYKDVSDFIVQTTLSEVPLPNEQGLFNVVLPINFSDGTVKGAEIGLYQPMDKLVPALAGFGFSANYTYVDTEFDKDVGDAGFGFPGSSKDNFNFIGFYDAGLYSVRLAYVYRGDFFRSLAGTGAQTTTARFTSAQEKLDLSVSLRPFKNISFMFNASNITGEKRRDYIGQESTFLDYFDRGRTYSVTATYRF